ncbi:MAG: SDR family NAD(P)-dependent oxidoreductase [Gammaproteobacteria bacterium]|nr:SDR family NAD(P)-dependent oxidoreductase [Gammaproteobacteria bacterium]
MSKLPSFADNLNVAVIGARGGIGAAFVEHLKRDERVARVHALTRSPGYSIDGKVWHCPIEITQEATIRNAAERVTAAEPADLVIVATGILHRGERIQPEKSLRDINADVMHEVLAVNAIGPTIVAKHFLPGMRRDSKSVFAVLSARVGSISDNRLGGWASYRASKAALNMLMKTLAIEHARSCPESIVLTLHPGTVDTSLSKPFQGRVPKRKLFTAAAAAQHLLRVIDGVKKTDTGGFFAWDGKPIDF